MATHDYVIANASGAAFRTDLNNALAAIVSNNSNSSSPATTYSYQFWADTTNGVLKIRNSANNAWIELFQLDGTLTMEDGSTSTPGLAFRSDLDTGIFRSSDNVLNISTGGTERIEFGADVLVVNDTGADCDFRIEGDTEANLFYVDAGNDRVGIGTASPVSTGALTVSQSATAEQYLTLINASNYGYGIGIEFKQALASGGSVITSGKILSDWKATNDSFMSFYTTGSSTSAERARIDSSGKLFVGRTSSITIASDATDHNFEQLTDNGLALALNCSQTNKRGLGILFADGGAHADFIRCQSAASGGTPKFLVLGTGNVQNANNSYGAISDATLKENIVDATSQWDDIKNIKIRNYNFKASTGYDTHTQIGLVAQELETVCPKLVDSSGKDGIKTVANSVLYMKAIKALQEAIAKIEVLETKVAALEAA